MDLFNLNQLNGSKTELNLVLIHVRAFLLHPAVGSFVHLHYLTFRGLISCSGKDEGCESLAGHAHIATRIAHLQSLLHNTFTTALMFEKKRSIVSVNRYKSWSLKRNTSSYEDFTCYIIDPFLKIFFSILLGYSDFKHNLFKVRKM